MKPKQHMAVVLMLTLSLIPGLSRAASQNGYRLTAPPAFPTFDTPSPSAWAATNGVSVIWTAGGSAKTTNTASQYPDAMAGVPYTAKYRLVESAIGASFEHIQPEYYLGDHVTAPTNVNWDATFARLTNSVSFLNNSIFYEPSVPAIIFAAGGLLSFDWVLIGGAIVPSHYQVSGSSSSKPYRIYWTDEPYNAPPVDLTGKFVKFYGDPGILTHVTGAVTNNAGGFISVSTNVVKGLFLDPATHWLKALGGIEGQVVMAYYRTGNCSDLLGTIAVEVCGPDVKTVPGFIGKQLLPTGDGYAVAGLDAMVTEGMQVEDDVGAYVYQHKGEHSYSPKNGNIYAIRKSIGEDWKIEIYWRQEDLLGTVWPFEVLHYACDWPADTEAYVRGQEAGSDGTVNYGLTIPIPKAYTPKLMEFQEPDGLALLDANNVFSTKGSGYSLLKLTGTDANGDDNVWFVPIQSIERDSPQFDLTPGDWPVGVEVAPLPTAIALDMDGTSGYLEADMTNNLGGSFTVEGWFQFEHPIVSSQGQTLFFKQARSLVANHRMDFRVDLLSSGIIQSYFEADTLGQVGRISTSSSVGMGDGLWHHVALVYDDLTTTSALYLDGNPTISTSFARTGMDNRDGSLFVGRNAQYTNDVNPDYFNGRVDDIRVWNRGLTTAEIKDGMVGFLHHATNATGLVAYYPIENRLGRIVEDVSGHGHAATMVNCIRVADGAVGLSDMAAFSKYHGYIYEAASGAYFNTNLYIRPDQMNPGGTASDPGSVVTGDPNALSADETYIFAINKTRAGDLPIEIWWSKEVWQQAMPDPLWFPAWVQQYQFHWPEEAHEVPEIVLASQQGSANHSIVKMGAAVDFSQSTESRMSIPNGNWFSGNNYTVECWIKPHSRGSRTGQVFDFNNGESTQQVALRIQADGSFTYTLAGDIAHAVTLSVTTAPVQAGRWTHLALVVSDGSAAVYQNGKTVYPHTALSIPAWNVVTTNNFLAYGSHGPTNVSFDGQIDEFRIWNVARSSNDVANTFLASLDGSDPGLRLCYSFDADVISSTDARYAYDRADQTQAYISYANWALPGAPRLDSGVLRATNAPFVYVQNDDTQPGYNPNEEHAFTQASEGGYVTYALRCDLNSEESSDPYVLVQYNDPANFGRPNMQVYHVVPTNSVYSEFASTMTAGALVPGPHPLDLLPDPWNEQTYWGSPSTRNNTDLPAYRDRKLQIWAKRAGMDGTSAELEMHNFYPMQDGFFFPKLGEEQPELGTPVPWLCCLSDNTQSVLTGTPIKWTWTVTWPSNSPAMDIGQTLTMASRGLPEVWGAKSMMLIHEPQADAVALYDPIVAQATGLEFEGDFAEHFGFESGPNGNIQQKNGKTFFKGVPPNVSDRFYFDPAAPKTACLKLVGNRVAPAGGLSYLQLNVLSAEEREALMDLAHDHTNVWREAIERLAESRVDTAYAHGAIPYDSVPVVNYALTHLGPGAGGYITLIENDARNPLCHVNDGDPIQMHILKLSTNLYAGAVLPLEDPNNLLGEQLDILYTESFAGRGGDYEFQWKRSQPNADGTTPTDYVNQYQLYRSEEGLTRFTIGKQGDTLPDMVNNFYVMRYRVADTNSELSAITGHAWSDWVGPTLAEGWVQRVLNSVTPFTQRMQDMYDNPAETAISMIQQAGGPYEGDVALNQDNLDNIGLIQLYQTILNHAESMSLRLRINDTAANQQLMLAATRLNDLYMLLGNEAYADAMDPTIGFGSDFFNSDDFSLGAIDYGALHSSLFCFDNLMPNLRDEELALLRGRSDQLSPSLHLSPTYNRLYWNFTKGITAGEVAYAMNYQIYGTDATIDQPQAAAFYPQGHGDAWGHYLSALYGYYRLMRNPYFSWGVPSISPMIVGDAVVDADYYDEAKFAEAAAAMARTGAEIVKRTCEKAYVEQDGAALAGYMDSSTNRAFGYGEWGSRAGLASLYNWAAANSLLPPSTNGASGFTDASLSRINRDSVGSLSDLSAAMKEVQRSVDMADAGMTSIGLSGDAIPFDIDPVELMNGTSHFEQILARAEQALGNAGTLLDRAQGISTLQRQQAQSAANMAQDLTNEEAALNIQLIGIFGYPYAADIGAGGTYPQGYEGPDLYHYMWMDLAQYGFADFELEPQVSKMFEVKFATIYGENASETRTLTFEFASNGMVVKPDAIQGTRRAQGRLQAAYGAFIEAYLNYRKAQIAYEEKVDFLKEQSIWATTKIGMNTALETYATVKGLKEIHELFEENAMLRSYYHTVELLWDEQTISEGMKESVPEMIIAGMAVGTSIGAPIKAALNADSFAGESIIEAAKNLAKMKYALSQNQDKRNQEVYTIIKDLANFTFESRETTSEFVELLMEANEAALDLDVTFVSMVNAQESYTSVLAEGEELLAHRERLRKQAANRIASGRYQDMAFRTFRSDALAKYGNAFDLAKKYTYLAAKAYDYETALGLDDESNNSIFREIVGARTIGFVEDGEAQLGGLHGDGGLADILARLKANWLVLKGRLGINNAQVETCWLSLRSELFRIKPAGSSMADTAWQNTLSSYRVDNLLAYPEFRRYCLPFASSTGLKAQEPGLVIPFSTTIDFARNVFGWPLAGNDNAFDSSHYATKIHKLGVKFIGYNNTTNGIVVLANEPRVYLIPVGDDIMRSPGVDGGTLLAYNVADQVVPLPFPLGSSLLDSPDWTAIYDAYTGNDDPLATLRRYPSLRAYHDHDPSTDDMISSTRLVGRSVWNTRWLLIIPAGTFHDDRDLALQVLINGTDLNHDGKLDQPGIQDIQIGFETYSNAGN